MKGLVGKDLEFYCEMRNDWKVLNRGRIWHEFILKGSFWLLFGGK